MSVVAEPLVTAEEFIRRHGHESGVELINGRIVKLPMPGAQHGEVTNEVAFRLTEHVKRNGLGRVFGNDTFVRVRSNPDTYRGPDVCFVSFTTLSRESSIPQGPLEFPPELVVEVRSPSDSMRSTSDKAFEYLEAGVKAALVFDPATASVGVYRAGEITLRYSNGDELTVPDVLPGFAVPVKQFFG